MGGQLGFWGLCEAGTVPLFLCVARPSKNAIGAHDNVLSGPAVLLGHTGHFSLGSVAKTLKPELGSTLLISRPRCAVGVQHPAFPWAVLSDKGALRHLLNSTYASVPSLSGPLHSGRMTHALARGQSAEKQLPDGCWIWMSGREQLE